MIRVPEPTVHSERPYTKARWRADVSFPWRVDGPRQRRRWKVTSWVFGFGKSERKP